MKKMKKQERLRSSRKFQQMTDSFTNRCLFVYIYTFVYCVDYKASVGIMVEWIRCIEGPRNIMKTVGRDSRPAGRESKLGK